MAKPNVSEPPRGADRTDLWHRWGLDKAATLQLLGGLFLPAAVLLSFLKWQRLSFWRVHSSAKDLDHVAYEPALSTVPDTIMTAPMEAFAVVRMDLFLVAAVALVAILGVHALRTRRARLYAVAAVQLAVIAWCQTEIISYFFFEHTGTNLDLNLAGLFITRIDELHHLVSAEGQASVPGLLAMFLVFFLALPWLIGRLVGGDRPARGERPSIRVFGAGALLAAVLVTAGLWPSQSQLPDAVLSNSAVHMVQTALRGTEGPEVGIDELDDPPFFGRLEPRDEDAPGARAPNIVMIILESTRPDDMSVYETTPAPKVADSNKPAATTPFLESIADDSLVFERHYTTVPHTSKALVSVLCGIYPHWRSITTEALPVSLPARCLPEMLARQGYATGFFQAATAQFEDRHMLVDNMGYESLFAAEDVASEDFEVVNYFGYEEDALLEPSFKWANEHADRPFLLTYLTVMSHSPYTAPGVDSEGRSSEQVREDYRDTIRYADRFIERIFEHFRKMELAEDTIFVILSDHGEAFGEHGIYAHNGVLYEEGVRSAMLVHAPGDPDLRGRREHLSSHLDVVPTVADAAGFSVEGASYPGETLIEPLPNDSRRRVMLHGWYDNRVLGTVDHSHKFIYYFSDRPSEYYDLREDPAEFDPVALPDENTERFVDRLLRARNANFLLYDAQKRGEMPAQRLSGDIVPEVLASAPLGPNISLMGVDRPRFFGPNRARLLNIYARVSEGSHPAGAPLRLQLRADGEPIVDRTFRLLDRPIEVDAPTVVGRAVHVRLPPDIDVTHVDLTLAPGDAVSGDVDEPAVELSGIEVRDSLRGATR